MATNSSNASANNINSLIALYNKAIGTNSQPSSVNTSRLNSLLSSLSGTPDSDTCCCNDYSISTANTGLGTISTGNPNLDGTTGSYLSVFTAGEKGSFVKSIIIKAIQPTLQGMIRIFIAPPAVPIGQSTGLYREITIPVVPKSASLSVPAPQFLMYQNRITLNLKLNEGYSILVSTQNSQSFNIIVEGLDWDYPAQAVSCNCNFEQDIANTGINVISAANPNLDGTGTIVPIFTAGAAAAALSLTTNGSCIKSLNVKALESTHEGAVRLFISPNGSKWSLLEEIWIPQTVQSSYKPSLKVERNGPYNLETGYVIGASTQNAEAFAVTIVGNDWRYA